MNKLQKFFDPETLARIRPLGLRARTLVEGLVAGLHRSPLRGQSLEFSQHREYAPGDDLRQVDWKVFARSDKYYLRQYEDETNLTCYLLLDQSESMLYRGAPNGLSKLEYAQLIGCSLAYLVTTQQDSIGLVTFSVDVDDWLRPSNSPNQFDDMVRMLEHPIEGHPKTYMSHVLGHFIARASKKGVVILISDLFDEVPSVLRALKMLRHAGHDVLVLQVLDPWELSFPFDRMSRFEGLEELPDVVTDPMLIAGAYRRAAAELCRQLELGCLALDSDYFRLVTDESLASSLPRILSSRLARRGS